MVFVVFALSSAVRAGLVEAGAFSPVFGLGLSKPGGCLGTVRAELVEALVCWFDKHAWVQGGSRESPGVRVTFFCFAKRKSPKKRRPPVCDPFAVRRGKPAAGRLRGAPWNSLCAARAARTSTASQFTRHGRFDAHAHPATAPPQAQPAGVGQPNIQQPNSRTAEQPTGHRCARPCLRSAWRLRPRDRAERSNGPNGCPAVWMFGCPTPAGCACGGAVAGWHARRSARAS